MIVFLDEWEKPPALSRTVCPLRLFRLDPSAEPSGSITGWL
ncbi:MAG TPA: hypothetical protein VH682_32810 [Gemmataceae bacterium]